MESLKVLRIPLFFLGLVLMFATERYFSVYDFHKYLRLAAGALCLLPLLTSVLLMRRAEKRQLHPEAKSWLYLSLWKATVLLGIALYFIYRWRLGSAPSPDHPLDKGLLVLWLTFIILGLAVGVGLELAHRTNGEGQTAEPNRLYWSGIGWLNIGLLASGLLAFNYATSNRDKVFDLSYFKTTKPGESTLKTAAAIQEPIEIALFFAKDSEVMPFAQEYIELVAKQNPKITVNTYDKDYNPLQAETYRASRNGLIILQKGEDQRQRIELGDKIETARRKLRTLDSDFQKALIMLTEAPKTAYFITSHGEMGWSGEDRPPLRSLKGLEAILKSQNIRTKTLGNAFSSIPPEASLVALVGPVTTLAVEEVSALRAYLSQGGKLLVSLDVEAGGESPEGISLGDQGPLLEVLQEMGLTFKKLPLVNDRDFVSMGRDSNVNRLFLYSNVFGSHESVTTLTRNDDKLNVLFFQSGTFDVQSAANGWKTVATILSTKSTFIDRNRNLQFDKDEVRNSYAVAAAAEKEFEPGKKAQVVAFADSTLLSDVLMTYNGNQFAVLDAFRWLNNRTDTAGVIESEEDVKIQHSKGRELFVFHGSIYLIPILILGLGFLANRRKRVRS